MPRQRPHHMIQPLAHQHHIHARRLQRLQMPHSFFFQQRLQLVFEFFFAQQIEPVARDPAQHGMHDASRGHAIAAYRNGRSTAINSTRLRRAARAINVWLFQVKKAIGRTVVSSSRLPSTRQ